MEEDPLGHVAALFSCLHVCKAEVDALEDARVDHVVGCSRETVIRASPLGGEWVRRRHREGHFVGPEEERQGTGNGTGGIVGPRSVVGIIRSVGQGLPICVADRLGVAIVVSFVNSRDPVLPLVDRKYSGPETRIGRQTRLNGTRLRHWVASQTDQIHSQHCHAHGEAETPAHPKNGGYPLQRAPRNSRKFGSRTQV